jgi:hypothetical protein
MSNSPKPTDAVIIERAFNIALEASETIALQANRVRRDEPLAPATHGHDRYSRSPSWR